MKLFNFLVALCAIAIFVSCSEEEDETSGSGMVTIMFENFSGGDELVFKADGSTDYNLTNAKEQAFNIDLMGYYISEIVLTAEDGSVYADKVEVSAEDAEGFYLITETIDGMNDNTIRIMDIPAGKYTSVSFTLGVSGDIVEEGATGGILDPANGAWFWKWAVGYVAFRIEGASEVSSLEDASIEYHIGGWGEPNNINQISLDLPVNLTVSDNSSSLAHIGVDALKAFAGHMEIDIAMTSTIHSPAAGEHMAHNFSSAFEIHHINNEYEGSVSH
ncbi:MAG: hypothetical protein OCD76_14195 [Reichenbachiella sp.]